MENYSLEIPYVDSKIDQILYTSQIHTVGGREGGSSKSSDGNLDVQLAVPGTSGVGTNPEQLFAAGWSACFFSAMKLVAGQMKVRFPGDAAIDAEVDLGMGTEGFALQARLNVSLPGLDPEVAQAIVKGAHETCPYSKATRGNINVEINLV